MAQIVTAMQTTSDHLNILSCYTTAIPLLQAEWKKKHSPNDLQQALDFIPTKNRCVILEDFNAHLGSRTCHNSWYMHVRGPHGLAKMDDTGKELLSFLELNEATLCNIWFEWKDYKSTWQHPIEG